MKRGSLPGPGLQGGLRFPGEMPTIALVLITLEAEETYQLNLHEGFIAVVQQVAGFSAVDSDDTQKQLTAQAECHGSLTRLDDGVDMAFNV